MYKKVKRNLKFFIPLLIKYNPYSIFIMFISAILSSFSSLIWVVFPKLIIDELMGDQSINKLIIIVVIFIVSKSFIDLFNEYAISKNRLSAYKADFSIQRMFNKKIMEVDYFNVEDPNFNDQMSKAKKAMNDHTNGIYSFIWTVRGIIYGVITVSGVIGIVIYSGEFLVVGISLIGVIINIIISIKYQQIDRDFNQSFSRHHRRMWYFNRTITGFRNQKELRAYNAKQLVIDAANKENNIGRKAYEKNTVRLQLLRLFDVSTTLFITRFLTLAVLGYSFYNRDMTVATLAMLFNAIGSLDDGMFSIVYNARSYYNDCIYQEEFINFMETESAFKNGNLPIKDLYKLEFRNVSFKYPRTDKYVLKNINFVIQNKEKVSIVGLNGSGKTTIIKLLCRFYEVSEGQIFVNDINIYEYDRDSYMQMLAIVFQDFKIISYSVKCNIAIIDDNQPKLYNVLERSRALEKIQSLPDKENTYVNKWFDKKGVEFSGGEMQKFAIARSLYKNCDLVILDEPTSALDPIAEAEIYYHYKDIIGEKLSIFISHRLSSCIFSDRILVLDGSSIVEVGNHKELMRNSDGLYYKMFNSQAEYYKK